jgi:lysophospholipase L1-like esterase
MNPSRVSFCLAAIRLTGAALAFLFITSAGCGSAGQSMPGLGSAGAAAAGSGVAGSAAAGGGCVTDAATSGSAGSGGAGASGGAGPGGSGGSDTDAGFGDVAGSGGAVGGDAGVVVDHDAFGNIVVLGSSTAAGTGPTNPANAWVERYRAYLKTNFPNFVLTNLAVGGYTTYEIQPSSYVRGANLPKPDPAHDITAALALKPDAIIINMPTNDTNATYPVAAQMANFERVTALAGQNNVSCWVTTSQPRNFTGDSASVVQAKQTELMAVRDAVTKEYGDHTLDFWTGFALPSGGIVPIYSAGDGTHLNDAAHAILAQRVEAANIPAAIITAQH